MNSGNKYSLLLNADDVGLHPDIDSAAEHLISLRRINAVSVIPHGPHASLENYGTWQKKGIFTGIHITLTQIPWITSSAVFPGWHSLIPRLISGRKNFLCALEKETDAQIQRMLDAGIQPDHIDSHEHVHMLPGLYNIFQKKAREYGIPTLRVPASGKIRHARQSLAGYGLHFLSLPKLRKAPLKCAGIRYSGFYDANKFAAELHSLTDDNYFFVFHPAKEKSIRNDIVGWKYNWQGEYELLLSDSFVHLLDKNGYFLPKRYQQA
jgi:chitin disaccharide deacetylase